MRHAQFAVLLAAAASCSPKAEGPLPTISVADGIDGIEATEIARLYFHVHVFGCGAVGEPTLDRGIWRFRMRVGYAGVEAGEIFVDARTGGVNSAQAWGYLSLEEFRVVLRTLATAGRAM